MADKWAISCVGVFMLAELNRFFANELGIDAIVRRPG
jgi:hypothetical protein